MRSWLPSTAAVAGPAAAGGLRVGSCRWELWGLWFLPSPFDRHPAQWLPRNRLASSYPDSCSRAPSRNSTLKSPSPRQGLGPLHHRHPPFQLRPSGWMESSMRGCTPSRTPRSPIPRCLASSIYAVGRLPPLMASSWPRLGLISQEPRPPARHGHHALYRYLPG